MRYWVANNDTTNLCVGSTVGPNIFVKICAWSTAQISRELIIQVKEEFGKIPKKMKLLNCVGGGSSAMGFWNEFMDTDAEFIGVEAGGQKIVSFMLLHYLMDQELEFFTERSVCYSR